MMSIVRVFGRGKELHFSLPPEIIEALEIKLGDRLSVTKTSAGFEVQKFDGELAWKMAVAEEVMRKNRDVLRRLAES